MLKNTLIIAGTLVLAVCSVLWAQKIIDPQILAQQEEQKKKAAVQLNRYIDHIVKRNPENYLDVIKNDLKHPSDFQGHVDDFFVDDEFYTKLDDIDISKEADKVIANLKVDQSF